MLDRHIQQFESIVRADHNGPGLVRIHDGQFLQHSQPRNVHNCYEADGALLLMLYLSTQTWI